MFQSLLNKLLPSNPKFNTKTSLQEKCVNTAVTVLQTEFSSKDGYFYNSVSQKDKDELLQFVVKMVTDAFASDNPRSKIRLSLVDFATQLGKVMVLSCTSEYAMHPGISGKLRDNIIELAKLDDEVQSLLNDLGVSNSSQSEMVSALISRTHFFNLPLTALNAVRIEMGDWTEDLSEDWFKPLCASYQIHLEDYYRNKLGIPSILNSSSESIVYSAFVSVVLEDHINPRTEWERRWVNIYDVHSPFFGVEL